MSFETQLEFGRVAESAIAAWLKKRGSAVLPAYEIEKSSGKGPQLFSMEGNFVVPDMLAFTYAGNCWIEAKHKSVFTWHRSTGQWTTGIDLRHYGEYFNVLWRAKLPIWLLFYHRSSVPAEKDRPHCPPECPTGLFGGKLTDLLFRESHRAPQLDESRKGMRGHGYSGMVYWSEKQLIRLATCEEVEQAAYPDRHEGLEYGEGLEE
jgi:hypothetical protein